jgi:hypothetical protein
MLGNSIGPVINYKLKILPLPFLVETTESTPFKRIFKFDCSVSDVTIKYEIIDYPCVQDKITPPTTVYTTNQEITAIRPKKIKLIASKNGYKDSKIVTSDLTIKPEITVDVVAGYPYLINTNILQVSQINLKNFKIGSNNYDYYYKCNDSSTTSSSLSFQCWENNKWNTLTYNGGTIINKNLTNALSVRVSFPASKDYGYSEGTTITKYIKPRFPRPTIVQSFTGRPAVVTIKKDYEIATNTDATNLVNDSKNNSIIYYTTDGTDPTSASSVYTTPLILNNDTVVKAICLSNNFDGTVGASYVNVGEVHYRTGSIRSVYTPSSSVSAVTILRVDGGGATSWRCSNVVGATNDFALAGIASRPASTGCRSGNTLIVSQGVDGFGMITRLNTNTTTTSTFYITAGLNTATLNDTSGDPTHITGSNRIKLTGNIIPDNNTMVSPSIWSYALTAMKLAPIINGAWSLNPDNTNNILNKYNYNLDTTLSEINNNISNMSIIYPIGNIGITLGNFTTQVFMRNAGAYIIEHYKD